MRRVIAAVTALALVAAGGCSGGSRSADGPPKVRYGSDVCTACRMSIDDPRFAASRRDAASGDVERFDDIGCVVSFGRSDEGAWVTDYGTGEWIKASEAWFAMPKDLVTPMGYGIVAFADQAAVGQYFPGGAIRWADLSERLLSSKSSAINQRRNVT